jgi:hypothetical protein
MSTSRSPALLARRALLALSATCAACGKPAPAPDVVTPASAPDAVAPAETAPTPPAADVVTPVAPNPKPALRMSEGWGSLDRDANALALSSDGRWLVTGDLGGHVAFFDRLAEGGPRFVWGELAKAGRIRAVACADAAPVCVAGGFNGPDHSLRRYDLTTLGGAPAAALSPASAGATGGAQPDAVAVGLSSDGVRQVALLAAGGEELGGQLVLTSGGAFDRLGAFPLERTSGPLGLVADGGVAVWGPPTGGLLRFDFPHPASGTPLPAGGARVAETPTLAHLSARRNATGDLIVHGAEGTTVHAWALPVSGEAPGEPHHTTLSDPSADARAPIRGLHRVGERTIAVTRPPSGGLSLWDADDGKLLARLETSCPCESHAISADGGTAACRCANGSWVRHGPTGLALSEAPAVAPTIPATTLPSAGDAGPGPTGEANDARP